MCVWAVSLQEIKNVSALPQKSPLWFLTPTRVI
jgi:hypothetical protein